jgi:sulfoxide reductase heme-binding subunit YedZ
MPTRERTAGVPAPILIAGAAALLAVAAGVASGGASAEDAARLAARYTARVAFPLLVLTYVASSLATLWPGERTRALLRQRRHWGLGFALAHFVHLGALVSFFVVIGERPDLFTMVGGGLAYLFLAAMAVTSTDAARRTLGPWWKRLHVAGMHWLWIVFAFTYLGRLSDPERFVQGAVLLPVAMAALLLRIAAWWKRRNTRMLATS